MDDVDVEQGGSEQPPGFSPGDMRRCRLEAIECPPPILQLRRGHDCQHGDGGRDRIVRRTL